MKKYQSEILKVIHQDAKGLHRLGIISDREMKEYDQGCLVQEPETAYAAGKSPKTEYAVAAK
jgi:DNA-binding transcriptional regulator YiaG